ncbi:MAG: hypothetical protein HC830_14540, partial [Bacteroidetes bacterium]|nr:hypothetical protein [Bacteroidota bacterium]
MIRKIITLSLLVACVPAFAQKTLHLTDPATTYKTGIELFEKQKYGAARRCFEQVTQDPAFNQTEIKANAQYYAALSAVELFNADAE